MKSSLANVGFAGINNVTIVKGHSVCLFFYDCRFVSLFTTAQNFWQILKSMSFIIDWDLGFFGGGGVKLVQKWFFRVGNVVELGWLFFTNPNPIVCNLSSLPFDQNESHCHWNDEEHTYKNTFSIFNNAKWILTYHMEATESRSPLNWS